MSSTDQTERNIKNPVVAIAGATGAVGVELMQCLEQRKFPLVELRLLASARSVGQVDEVPRRGYRGAGTHRRQPRGRGHRAVLGRRRAVEALRARGGEGWRGGRRQLLGLPHGSEHAAGGARRSTPARSRSTTASSRTRIAWRSLLPRRCGRCTRSAASSASPCPPTRPLRAPAPPRWKSSASPRARISKAAPFTPKVLPHPYAFNVFSPQHQGGSGNRIQRGRDQGDAGDAQDLRRAGPARDRHLRARARVCVRIASR